MAGAPLKAPALHLVIKMSSQFLKQSLISTEWQYRIASPQEKAQRLHMPIMSRTTRTGGCVTKTSECLKQARHGRRSLLTLLWLQRQHYFYTMKWCNPRLVANFSWLIHLRVHFIILEVGWRKGNHGIMHWPLLIEPVPLCTGAMALQPPAWGNLQAVSWVSCQTMWWSLHQNNWDWCSCHRTWMSCWITRTKGLWGSQWYIILSLTIVKLEHRFFISDTYNNQEELVHASIWALSQGQTPSQIHKSICDWCMNLTMTSVAFHGDNLCHLLWSDILCWDIAMPELGPDFKALVSSVFICFSSGHKFNNNHIRLLFFWAIRAKPTQRAK